MNPIPFFPVLLLATAFPTLAQTAAPAAPAPFVAASEPAVKGAAIRALVFISDAAQMDARGRALDSLRLQTSGLPVDVSQAPLLQGPGFAELLQERGLIGAPLDSAAISRLHAAVYDWLRTHGQGAAVVIPEQDATNGVVQVLVRQPRLGTLKVEGAREFSESSYLDAVRARPGAPINMQALDEDLAWIGRSNPFRSAVAVAAPGGQPGETDLTLQVTEQRPWRLNLWAENTGTDSTQRERLGAGFTYGNMFGLGHIAGYHLSTSPDARSYVGHTVIYSVPLPWRDTLNISANYARIHARLPAPLDSDGTSSAVSLRYDKSLPAWNGLSQAASLALAYKSSNNNLLFSDIPVVDNTTNIVQLEGGYELSGADRWGDTRGHLLLVLSPGGAMDDNSDKAFDASRAGAKANYQYLRLTVDRSTDLLAGWQWRVNLVGQWASENLLGTEQIGLMGMYGVRGFEEGGLYADQGVLWRNEIGPRAFALGSSGGQMRVFATLDAASARSVNRLPGERSYRFSSAGLGMNLLFAGANLWLEVAKPIDTNWDDKGGWRAHAGIRWAY